MSKLAEELGIELIAEGVDMPLLTTWNETPRLRKAA